VPSLGLRLLDGFEYDVTPGSSIAIPIQIVNQGNAPVSTSIEAKTLSAYKPQGLASPEPFVTPMESEKNQNVQVRYVKALVSPGVGNINETLAIEIRVEATPMDIEYAPFYTEARLWVVHVNVRQSHLEAAGGAPSVPAWSVVLAVVGVALRSHALRSRVPR
jgi:hypothetical protein